MPRVKRYGKSVPKRKDYDTPEVKKPEAEKSAEEIPVKLGEFDPAEDIVINETIAAEPSIEETKPVKTYGDWPRKADAYCEVCALEIVFGRDVHQGLGAGRYRCHKHFA